MESAFLALLRSETIACRREDWFLDTTMPLSGKNAFQKNGQNQSYFVHFWWEYEASGFVWLKFDVELVFGTFSKLCEC